MKNYASNARINAKYSKKLPLIQPNYFFKEIEIFYGDYSDIPYLYWQEGEWSIVQQSQLEREDTDIRQIRIDGDWAHIQVGNNVLLDRLNGVELPKI